MIYRPGSIIAEFSVTFSGEEDINTNTLNQDINTLAALLPPEVAIDPEFTAHTGESQHKCL